MILPTNLLMSIAFHPETDGLSENSKQTVIQYSPAFTTQDRAHSDDYLPLWEYASNSLVYSAMKQMPSEHDVTYEPPLPLDIIADLQQPQADESAKSLHACEFVERLQYFLGVFRDQLHNALGEQVAEAKMSQGPIDPTIAGGAKVFRDTKYVPITYANVNPTRCKLVYCHIGQYEIL